MGIQPLDSELNRRAPQCRRKFRQEKLGVPLQSQEGQGIRRREVDHEVEHIRKANSLPFPEERQSMVSQAKYLERGETNRRKSIPKLLQHVKKNRTTPPQYNTMSSLFTVSKFKTVDDMIKDHMSN